MGLSGESSSSGVRTVNVNETWWLIELLGYREGILMNEQKLFEHLKTHYISDLEKTDQFDPKDAYSKQYNMHIELKSRYTHYDELLIEKIKWDKLIAMSNPRYVNWTPNGIYSFDISSVTEPKWFEHTMPATTEFDNVRKVIKVVGYLPISSSTSLKTGPFL